MTKLSADTGRARQVQLHARSAAMRALPSVCSPDLVSFSDRLRPLIHDSSAFDRAVREWARSVGLEADWFCQRFGNTIAQVLQQGFDIGAPDQWPWDVHVWADDEFLDRAQAVAALESQWRDSAAPGELRPVEAFPFDESLDAFLDRAKRHYQARQRSAAKAGLRADRRRFTFAEDARLFLRRQVKRETYQRLANVAHFRSKATTNREFSAIAAVDKTKKRVRRFAALAGFRLRDK